MGIYLNPGNSGFEEMLRSEYVDKTGMIGLINRTIGTKEKLTCISRPRRFGKSYAAQMLCAYYDKTCDSHDLFGQCRIAGDETYEDHINRYDVIYVDMTGIKPYCDNYRKVVPFLIQNITSEIVEVYPSVREAYDLSGVMVDAVNVFRNKFIMIIDEWDAPIRESKGNPAVQKEYLEFLRSLFKNSGTTSRIFAAAYMTGILPIKKDGSQSAISDFIEYPMLYPDGFVEYTGFTEDDVKGLCEEHHLSFEEMKAWYDGYDFTGYGSIYNPFSVMSAMREKKFRSYWKKTSSAESLMKYINMDFEGMQEIISRLIAGEEIEVDTDSFENDFETFHSRDDVLTLLIHLGYLSYHEDVGTVRIPNEEVRMEFHKILKDKNANPKWVGLIARSQQLLDDTIAGKTENVAKAIQTIRDSEYAPTFYNNEQSLRYVIKFAYVAAIEKYLRIEELPSGHGIADVVFVPKRWSPLPAMIVELKWNRTSEGALAQVKSRNYPAALKDYGGELILVGVNYDEDTKLHTCSIEVLR